ncbi:MAG: helix-turn-helix transcriptional regulator [Isosphaeraceae bacterium]|nr:helix-turn-helix transcriptional regulator [Isosphaeraceae bacterium]
MPSTFAARLRDLRQSAGYTQEELGVLCGWTKARISELERERDVKIRRETTVTLAAALGCQPSAIDPDYQIEVPDGAVVLRPDRDVVGLYRPWREQDRERVGDSVDHTEIAALTTRLSDHGLGLYFMP